MTREEAIKELKILREDYWEDDGYGHETIQNDDTMFALDMAIKALEQQPCDDCISRQAVINAINHNCIYENEYNLTASHIMEKVKQLPPVTLQRCEDWYDVPSDEMTLEQARQAVKDLRKKLAERLEQESCDDCINRQAAIDTIESWLSCDDYNETERHIMRAMQSVLYDLPSVTPEEKTGHWIDEADNIDALFDRHKYKCSKCGELANYFVGGSEDWWNLIKPNFCPNCGAKMQEVENDTN